MDILGALLGKKSGSGSIGGKILKDMLGRATGSAASSRSRSRPSEPSRGHHPRSRRPASIENAAMELEELLGVSTHHHQSRTRPSRQTGPAPAQTQMQTRPAPTSPAHSEYSSRSPEERTALDAQAIVLVRAMICAAKSDNQITPDEEEAIIKQLEHVGDEEIRFLREEFRRPVDVRELSWSVPLGMEEQTYRLSLIAIDLDERKEAEYLADLAHGLRISPSRCNEIHRQLGAPTIFR